MLSKLGFKRYGDRLQVEQEERTVVVIRNFAGRAGARLEARRVVPVLEAGQQSEEEGEPRLDTLEPQEHGR